MEFTLRDFPGREILEKFSKSYKEIDVSSTFAWLTFLKASREVSVSADKHFARYNLSPGKFSVLMLLMRYKAQGGLAPSELAGKAGVTRATMTGLIDGLEKAEYVSRRSNSQDRRKSKVNLTEKGFDFLDSILPDHFSKVSGFFSDLTESEKEQLIIFLEKISASLSKRNKEYEQLEKNGN